MNSGVFPVTYMKIPICFISLMNSMIVSVNVFIGIISSPFLHQGFTQRVGRQEGNLIFHVKKSSLPKANSKSGIICGCFLYHLMLCWFCSSCKWLFCSKPSCSQHQWLHTGWAKILPALAIPSKQHHIPRAGLWLAWNTAQCQQEHSSPVFNFFLP